MFNTYVPTAEAAKCRLMYVYNYLDINLWTFQSIMCSICWFVCLSFGIRFLYHSMNRLIHISISTDVCMHVSPRLSCCDNMTHVSWSNTTHNSYENRTHVTCMRPLMYIQQLWKIDCREYIEKLNYKHHEMSYRCHCACKCIEPWLPMLKKMLVRYGCPDSL